MSNHPDNKHSVRQKPAQPIQEHEEVAKNPDPRIDEDFKGFPHAPAQKEIIRPKTENEEKTAGTAEKADQHSEQSDPQLSDGSARAFEETEENIPSRPDQPDENHY